MMSKVITASLFGLKGRVVQVEVDLARGFPGYYVVGLASTTIRESGYRVRSSMINEGYPYPTGRITINLSPAESKKEGSHFDLPIAVGLLAAMGQVPADALREVAFFGELSLDGRLIPIKGALPLIMTTREVGIKKVVLPAGNGGEVSLSRDIEVHSASTLKEVVGFLNGEIDVASQDINGLKTKEREKFSEDYSDVRGQENAKRALVISAAGGHGILMRGSPGSGKTMMARRLPTILPPLTWEEKVEVTNIYSIAGLLSEEEPFIEERPFRSPHHTITMAGLLGGGRSPRPGEFSLAHRGVLFLDELMQFEGRVLEALRQPMEEERVMVARQGGAAIFPGKVILVAAANPCKCGYGEDPAGTCTCSASEIDRYGRKLSNPFLDRIDLQVRVNRSPLKVIGGSKQLTSEEMAKIVNRGRERQLERYRREGTRNPFLNSQLTAKEAVRYCLLTKDAEYLLNEAYESLALTMRTYYKTMKIARTIADMDEAKQEKVHMKHIAEALQYRGVGNENHGDT